MNNPHDNIAPHSLWVQKIFEDHYIIPGNQREYSWNASDQVDRLWDDIQACREADFGTNENDILGHFLGTMVVIGDEKSTPDEPHSVIDGQQRLTTLSILVRVLIEAAMEENLPQEQLTDLTTKLKPMLSIQQLGKTHPRLTLNRENAFFQESIVNSGSKEQREKFWDIALSASNQSKAKMRIVHSFRRLEERLSDDLSSKGPAGSQPRTSLLNQYIEVLTDHFYILKVRVDNLRMAYRLFETLNERGLDLSQADLVKNKLIENSHQAADSEALAKQKREEVESCWNDMVNAFEAQDVALLDKIPEVIQFSYSSRHGVVRADGLFDKISERLGEEENKISATELAKQFKQDAEFFNTFIEFPSKWHQDARWSAAFIGTKSTLWKKHAAPLIFRLIEKFNDSTDNSLSLTLRLLENYLFREGIVGRASVNTLERDLGEAARIVASKNFDLGHLVKHLQSRSSDSAFIQGFSDARAGNNKLGYYVMWRIEQQLLEASGTGVIPDAQASELNHLEHIMPKKPNEAWGGIERLDEFNTYKNRYGNLLILPSGHNKTLQNLPIESKITYPNNRDCSYERQTLELPREVAHKRAEWCPKWKWDFDSIAARQKHLAEKYASKVWTLSLT